VRRRVCGNHFRPGPVRGKWASSRGEPLSPRTRRCLAASSRWKSARSRSTRSPTTPDPIRSSCRGPRTRSERGHVPAGPQSQLDRLRSSSSLGCRAASPTRDPRRSSCFGRARLLSPGHVSQETGRRRFGVSVGVHARTHPVARLRASTSAGRDAQPSGHRTRRVAARYPRVSCFALRVARYRDGPRLSFTRRSFTHVAPALLAHRIMLPHGSTCRADARRRRDRRNVDSPSR